MSDLLNTHIHTLGYQFQYVPICPHLPSTNCKNPISIDWPHFIKLNHRIVITGAPAAFSPTCSKDHIPGYIAESEELFSNKGVDQIVILTVDSPFVLQAWAKELGVKDSEHIKFGYDSGCKFIKSLGLELEVEKDIFYSGRWAMIIEDGMIKYVGKEKNPYTDVTASSVESIYAHL